MSVVVGGGGGKGQLRGDRLGEVRPCSRSEISSKILCVPAVPPREPMRNVVACLLPTEYNHQLDSYLKLYIQYFKVGYASCESVTKHR